MCPEVLMSPLRRAGDRLSRSPAGSRLSHRTERAAAYLRRPSNAALLRAAACRKRWEARGSISSAKIFSTPARTRSTMRSARLCSRGAWARERIIAETGAGQHGVATATVCALFGLDCIVYMGEEDMRRQRLNVFRMRLLGAKVEAVKTGSRTLKDAISEAMRDWVTNVATHALPARLGARLASVSAHGARFSQGHRRGDQVPDPGSRRTAARSRTGLRRRRQQCDRHFSRVHSGTLGSSDRRGGGRPWRASLANTRRDFPADAPACCMARYSYVLQDGDGQISLTHSVSAGLDYASVGPEHALLRELGRAEYVSITDAQALEAASRLSRAEGLIPALESAHAVAEAIAPGAGGEGRDLHRQSLRPRRQGHRHLPRKFPGARFGIMPETRITRTIRPTEAGRPQRIHRLHHGRRSVARAERRRWWKLSNAAARTSSSWACRSPIPSPTVPSSSEPDTARSKREPPCARCSKSPPKFARAREIPLLLFTYLNPVMRYGIEQAGGRRQGRRHRRMSAHRRQRRRGRRNTST